MVVLIDMSLRLVFDELLKVVVAEAIQTARFKTVLKRLERTIKSIEPVFYENRRLVKVLDRPQKETVMFISYLKTGKRLVLKSSSIMFRNRYQVILHSYKLIRLNNELVRFCKKEFQVKIPIEINNLEHKVDQLLPVYTTHSSVEACFVSYPGDEAFYSNGYDLPESINSMDHLKVLTIKENCDHTSKLHNLASIASLSNLTALRFEYVSVPSLQPIFALRNLKQLSFVMCEIGDALMSFTTESPYNMLPNLTHFKIDMCYDIKELPSWLCNLARLKKLSITNCHELDDLPKGLGGLSSLESLSLHSCTKLQELPASIGSLRSLNYIDISDCLSIGVLPEEIGELCGLRVLKMNGCTGLQQLPPSTSELSQLEEVICDEETLYLWMDFESDLSNLKINVVEDDTSETFMKIVQ